MTKILWTVIVAFAVNLAVYFGSKYFDPSIAEDIKFVTAAADILIAAVLLHFYGEDSRAKMTATIQSLNK